MAARMSARIHISIGRLMLRGFDEAQRAPVAAQLRAELSRLLADPAIAVEIARSRHVPTLRIPAAPAAMSAWAPAGVQAAASIVRGLRE